MFVSLHLCTISIYSLDARQPVDVAYTEDSCRGTLSHYVVLTFPLVRCSFANPRFASGVTTRPYITSPLSELRRRGKHFLIRT